MSTPLHIPMQFASGCENTKLCIGFLMFVIGMGVVKFPWRLALSSSLAIRGLIDVSSL